MPTVENDIVCLSENAKAAFPQLPVPLNVLIAGDHIGDIWADVDAKFLGKSWVEISLDTWINTASIQALSGSFFTPQAFHYYVPSILIASLQNPNYLDWGLDSVLPKNKHHVPRGDWWKEYRSCFTSEQENVVREFLELASAIANPSSGDAGLCEVVIKLWENL